MKEHDEKKANRIPDEYKDPLEYAREYARIPDEYIDRYKSVHNPDTYQQTYQDRLRRVRLSMGKRLLYKKDKEWYHFDPAPFFHALQLKDDCHPEEATKIKAALQDICDSVPRQAIDAAWAWYALNMAAEYDTDGDTIIMAYQCLMGETEGAKQARRRKGGNWYTKPLFAMCNATGVAVADIAAALPDRPCAEGIASISWWWRDIFDKQSTGAVLAGDSMDEESVVYYLKIVSTDGDDIERDGKQIATFVNNCRKTPAKK